MTHIDDVMQILCDAGARALRRFDEVSGMDVPDMPEYLVPAFIFSDIGNNITMTLETGFAKLWEWNNGTRLRQGMNPRSPEDEARLLLLAITEMEKKPRC
jgi:hypothetical protein